MLWKKRKKRELPSKLPLEPQSQVIVAQGEKRGQAIIDEAKEQAQVEADKIIAAARAQAAQEIQAAKDVLRDQVANLAVSGASQILGKEVDASAHQQLHLTNLRRNCNHGRDLNYRTSLCRSVA